MKFILFQLFFLLFILIKKKFNRIPYIGRKNTNPIKIFIIVCVPQISRFACVISFLEKPSLSSRLKSKVVGTHRP